MIARLRLGGILALALAVLGLIGAVSAQRASAAYPYASCSTVGAYINAYEPGGWNNTIGHKVVCSQDIDVQTELYRYNRSTGATTRVALYTWNAANSVNGTWVNWVNPAPATTLQNAPNVPLYRGSTYSLTVWVKNVSTGAWTPYYGPPVAL